MLFVQNIQSYGVEVFIINSIDYTHLSRDIGNT